MDSVNVEISKNGDNSNLESCIQAKRFFNRPVTMANGTNGTNHKLWKTDMIPNTARPQTCNLLEALTRPLRAETRKACSRLFHLPSRDLICPEPRVEKFSLRAIC
jgi:hypothetical protein